MIVTGIASTVTPQAAVAPPPVARGPVRPPYLVVGVALLGVTIWAAVAADTGASSVLLFAVLPDVALLLANGGSHRPGQLPRRAVRAYNPLHHPAGPALLAAAAGAGLLTTYWLVAAMSRATHISFDRGSGYGLRTGDGWQRG